MMRLDDEQMSVFLDRLMRAESGGRDDAKNPLSSALGPFQFIKSTFLGLVRKHFPDEIDGLSETEILALRTNRAFARTAALIYTREAAEHLQSNGLVASMGALRLAYLLGPGGATRVLKSPRSAPVAKILGRAVVAANPFMRRMTAADLIRRTARDVGAAADVAATPESSTTRAAVRRIVKLAAARSTPSCKRRGPTCKRIVVADRRDARGDRKRRA